MPTLRARYSFLLAIASLLVIYVFTWRLEHFGVPARIVSSSDTSRVLPKATEDGIDEGHRAQDIYQDLQLVGMQIRLLVLEPSKDFSDEIRSHLQTLDISSSREYDYEALSYHWGSSKRTRDSYINGRRQKITDSLNDALRHLRHPTAERRLWVDAVCINQADVDELNRQVAFMREVYSRASQVVVWLGHLDESSRTAIEAIRLMGGDKTIHLSSEHENHARINGLTFENVELRAIMIAFFHIPWFRRVWTAQEILLAREATFLCGDESFSLLMLLKYIENNSLHWLCCEDVAFADALHGIETRSTGLLDEITVLIFTFGMRKDYNNISASNPRIYAHFGGDSAIIEDQDLLGLLAYFRQRQSTNPRDRIYGILGLARPGIQAELKPDYRLSTQQVFVDATIAMIRESGNLNVLSHVYGAPTLDLPSWVPDWTSRIDDLPMHQGRYQNLNDYQEGGGWRSPPRLIGSDTLLVEGVLFEEIEDTTSIAGDVPNKEFLLHAQRIAARACGTEIFEPDRRPRQGVTLEGDFWHTFLDECAPYVEPETEFSSYSGSLDYRDVFLPSKNLARAWLSYFLAEDFSEAPTEILKMQTAFWAHIAERRFVSTRNGRFGFAPASAQVGDKLSVLLGGPMVYALRPTESRARGLPMDSTYNLVGDAKLDSNPSVWEGVIRGSKGVDLSIEEIYLI